MADIIKGREAIFNQLNKLQADQKPAFGKMSPQHMVEHLAFVIKFSNGKLPQKLHYNAEKAEKFKQNTIYSDKELMPGFRAPMLGDEPEQLIHSSQRAALENLRQELEAFDTFSGRCQMPGRLAPPWGS
ncbi:hypothetical protein [Pontibacter mangrovi]|uniref:DinB family protein n=1 Tax=Pontibacter mangrovi TaxID=2589816 RepID=A0A501WFI4_9BACT|nr:hypothetical protein [Pontibacter mangrovi]TPE45941.1 hypothetical protein FJM65_00935 [Pontibacter mangrovi]